MIPNQIKEIESLFKLHALHFYHDIHHSPLIQSHEQYEMYLNYHIYQISVINGIILFLHKLAIGNNTKILIENSIKKLDPCYYLVIKKINIVISKLDKELYIEEYDRHKFHKYSKYLVYLIAIGVLSSIVICTIYFTIIKP